MHRQVYLRIQTWTTQLSDRIGSHADEIDYMITHISEPEAGQAIFRKSIVSFNAKVIEDPDLHKKENLGIVNSDFRRQAPGILTF